MRLLEYLYSLVVSQQGYSLRGGMFRNVATPGSTSKLCEKIKPKISSHVKLIFPLNGPFEEKYWGSKFALLPGLRPVEEKARANFPKN